MNRRGFLAAGILGSAGIASVLSSKQFLQTANASQNDFPLNLEKAPQQLEILEIDDQFWKQHLDAQQYRVLRKHATERAFSSPLNDEKRTGDYVCAGCGLLLFSDATKFDSGTGWPSFFDGHTDHIGTSTDFKLVLPRTEYHCKRCGGHQGHVFKDGPQPTGLRYCNNGVALIFVPSA